MRSRKHRSRIEPGRRKGQRGQYERQCDEYQWKQDAGDDGEDVRTIVMTSCDVHTADNEKD